MYATIVFLACTMNLRLILAESLEPYLTKGTSVLDNVYLFISDV